MITMVIDDRLLTSRSAFVCLCTTKSLYQGINEMKPSDDNNIVGGLFSRNQDILLMKFLDTLFQMPKRQFGFRWEKIEVIRVKRNRGSYTSGHFI